MRSRRGRLSSRGCLGCVAFQVLLFQGGLK